jgi:hypothetical protein
MQFRLVRTEYDHQTNRAYIELRTGDSDGGEAIATAIFSFKTTAGQSKRQLKEDVVRKARHILKQAAKTT